ncbi:hypothetical protein PanWU01x14_292300 [Parasponia andersonii]|uniref:Uncharacterized protein n=1 Tax=Parasponia andersonii TaxID=3476 RepID=A0A2P5AX42_PARAD|nr:hypothetical protein PanWU01x14_292300 [Parasponia andersonii]
MEMNNFDEGGVNFGDERLNHILNIISHISDFRLRTRSSCSYLRSPSFKKHCIRLSSAFRRFVNE